jgi:PKD repeat protein
VTITVDAVSDPPVAIFTYSCEDLTCSFDASDSYHPDGASLTYAWDFGDAQAGTGETPTHIYGAAGTYSVTLTVGEKNGDLTDSDTQSVTVEWLTMHVGDLEDDRTTRKNRWTAKVTVAIHDSDEMPVDGATVNGTWSNGVTGTGQCTTDASGECTVELGELTKNTPSVWFTVVTVTHHLLSYDPLGNHDVDGDSSGTAIQVYRVPPPNQPPVADFDYSCTDLVCVLGASDSYDPDGTIVRYDWDYGDGSADADTGVTTTHTYATDGGYPVVLTVTDGEGTAGQSSQTIVLGSADMMHMGGLDGASISVRNKWTAVVIVTVHDDSHGLVSGATVAGRWSVNKTGQCMTVGGHCEIRLEGISTKLSNVTFTVESVTHDTRVYDPESDHGPVPIDGRTAVTVYWP